MSARRHVPSDRPVPVWPTRLLSRLLTGEEAEVLIGDLSEAYRTGRSTGWYWRQTLYAIVFLVRREIGRNPSAAVTTLAVAALSFFALRKLRDVVWYSVTNGLAIPVSNWLLANGHGDAYTLWFTWQLYDVPGILLWWAVCAWYGRSLVRWHPSPTVTTALVCGTAAAVNVAWWLAIYANRLVDPSPAHPHAVMPMLRAIGSVMAVGGGAMWIVLSTRGLLVREPHRDTASER